MRKLLICTLLSFLSPFVMAQNPESRDSVFYNNEDIVINEAQNATDYIEANVPEQQIKQSKVRIALDFGYSYRVAKAEDDYMKSFINKMRSGYVYGIDIHGLHESGIGIGVKFTGHHYSYSESGLSDKVNTYYIAPSLIFQRVYRKGNVFYYGASIGFLAYREKAEVSWYSTSVSEQGVGFTVDIGYDFRLRNNDFLGLKLALIAGKVDIGNDVKESLAAIDISVGYRF